MDQKTEPTPDAVAPIDTGSLVTEENPPHIRAQLSNDVSDLRYSAEIMQEAARLRASQPFRLQEEMVQARKNAIRGYETREAKKRAMRIQTVTPQLPLSSDSFDAMLAEVIGVKLAVRSNGGSGQESESAHQDTRGTTPNDDKRDQRQHQAPGENLLVQGVAARVVYKERVGYAPSPIIVREGEKTSDPKSPNSVSNRTGDGEESGGVAREQQKYFGKTMKGVADRALRAYRGAVESTRDTAKNFTPLAGRFIDNLNVGVSTVSKKASKAALDIGRLVKETAGKANTVSKNTLNRVREIISDLDIGNNTFIGFKEYHLPNLGGLVTVSEFLNREGNHIIYVVECKSGNKIFIIGDLDTKPDDISDEDWSTLKTLFDIIKINDGEIY